MKRLSVFIIVLCAFAACKTATVDPIIINAVSPTITGFSQDTAWTFSQITLYGTNFGYDPRDVPVRFDTAQADVISVADTVMRVIVPEYARSGYVYVTKLKQTGKSKKPIVINYSFNPHGIVDSVPLGGSFSIPGTGLTNHHGPVKILVNGIQYPVDSVFPERIVSHVVANGSSGQVSVTDDDGGNKNYLVGGVLYVTRYCVWNTVSAVWDNLVMQEVHHRTGYQNGPGHPVDSTWTTTSMYSMTMGWPVTGLKFARSERGLQYDIAQPNYGPSAIGVAWDTVSKSINCSIRIYSSQPATDLHSLTTYWYPKAQYPVNVSTPFVVDHDVDFQVSDFWKQVVEDSTDQQGLVKYREVTNSTPVSGTFSIHFKQ